MHRSHIPDDVQQQVAAKLQEATGDDYRHRSYWDNTVSLMVTAPVSTYTQTMTRLVAAKARLSRALEMALRSQGLDEAAVRALVEELMENHAKIETEDGTAMYLTLSPTLVELLAERWSPGAPAALGSPLSPAAVAVSPTLTSAAFLQEWPDEDLLATTRYVVAQLPAQLAQCATARDVRDCLRAAWKALAPDEQLRLEPRFDTARSYAPCQARTAHQACRLAGHDGACEQQPGDERLRCLHG